MVVGAYRQLCLALLLVMVLSGGVLAAPVRGLNAPGVYTAYSACTDKAVSLTPWRHVGLPWLSTASRLTRCGKRMIMMNRSVDPSASIGVAAEEIAQARRQHRQQQVDQLRQQQPQQQPQQERPQPQTNVEEKPGEPIVALEERIYLSEAEWRHLGQVAKILVGEFSGRKNVVWSALLGVKELDRLQQNFRNGDDRHVVLLARDRKSDAIIGVVDVDGRKFPPEKQKDCPTPYLSDLAVMRPYQRQGIGRYLVQACEDIVASRWKYPTLHLKVASSNAAALALYDALGYTVLLPEDGSGQILLGKDLKEGTPRVVGCACAATEASGDMQAAGGEMLED